MTSKVTIQTVLFDLGDALNRMREEAGMPPLSLDLLSSHASSGVKGLIGAGFGIQPKHEISPHCCNVFSPFTKARYVPTRASFPGGVEFLSTLEQRGIRWGIVTNKIERFPRPVMAGPRKLLPSIAMTRPVTAGQTCAIHAEKQASNWRGEMASNTRRMVS